MINLSELLGSKGVICMVKSRDKTTFTCLHFENANLHENALKSVADSRMVKSWDVTIFTCLQSQNPDLHENSLKPADSCGN